MTELRTAGIVSRSVAAVIDLFVVLVFMGLVYLGTVLAVLAFSPRAFSFPTPSVVFSTLGFGVVAVVYLAACWTISGCTAGAVVMGIRVVSKRADTDAALMRPSVGLLRAIACVFFPIGLGWVVLDHRRRSLQDIVFGSRVVYNRVPLRE